MGNPGDKNCHKISKRLDFNVNLPKVWAVFWAKLKGFMTNAFMYQVLHVKYLFAKF